jgi:elongation factor Tu
VEVRELLSKYQFPGDKTPIIIGSALKALEGDPGELGEQSIMKLADALDAYIPTPERATAGPFLMPVEGRVLDLGSRHGGDGARGARRVQGGRRDRDRRLEAHDQDGVHGNGDVQEAARPGAGGRQRGDPAARDQARGVERGQVLAKPGSITPHTKFECEVYVLSKEEGGRHTPFFNGYRPQFYFRTTDVTGALELPTGVEMVMPGDNIKMTVTLIAPDRHGGEAALRHPRGRPHRRRRRRHQGT